MDERYFDLSNYNKEDSYTRLDLQASWTSSNGRYKILATVDNATDEEMYNISGCLAAADGVYGTPSWVIRCGGNPMNQRLWATEFSVRF